MGDREYTERTSQNNPSPAPMFSPIDHVMHKNRVFVMTVFLCLCTSSQMTRIKIIRQSSIAGVNKLPLLGVVYPSCHHGNN